VIFDHEQPAMERIATPILDRSGKHVEQGRAVAMEIEEHRAAAKKRLDVPPERARIERPQLRQELPLAADPLQ